MPTHSSLRLRLQRLLLGGLRATLVAFALVGTAAVVSARQAEQRLGEKLHGFGEALMAIHGVTPHSQPRQLSVNGAELELVTFSTRADVATTLGQLRRICRQGGVVTPESLQGGVPDEPRGLLEGIFEQQSEHEGVLACLDTGGKLELVELVARLGELRRTGDLHALGGLRYAVLRRSRDTTHVLAFWSDAPLVVTRMFPSTGDAPGRDPAGLPRPANTRRLLSAAEHDAPYAVTLYETSTGSVEQALAAQRGALERDGWHVELQPANRSLVANREGRGVVYVAGRLDDGKTFLSVAELARF